jgi:predicted transcriptional regulator
MHRGYFTVWRKIKDNPLYKNPATKVIWLELSLRTSFKTRWIKSNGHELEIKRGQALFGIKELSEINELSVQKTRTALKKLEKWQILTIKTTNKGSVATFINYEEYNEEKDQNNKQNNKQVTNKQQTSNKQVTTNNNYNNSKNVKKEREEQFTPPTIQQIFEYGKEKNCSEEWCKEFFEYWEAGDWKLDGRTWQQKLLTKINMDKQKINGLKSNTPDILTEEDYSNEF